MQASERVEVPGSERRLEPQHSRVGEIDMTEEVEVTVYLRPRASLGWVDDEAKRSPAERRRPTREEYAAAYGADPADVDAVRAFATHAGLTVTTVDLARRSVGLRGSVQAVADAFEAKLTGRFATSDRSSEYRARTGPLTVPASLGGIVTAVLGVDDRPQARVHFRAAAGGATSYTPVQVAEAYAFPAGSTGAGETVGIIELGGGFSTTDLATYFQGLGLSTPSVTAVSVDGGANSPGTDQNADGEVMLDIEVVGATANGATIAVYFAPNTDQGFIDAVSTAVNDTTRKPSVVSISWGGPEDSWTAQARTQMETVLTDAAGLGVTVTVAAGDNGSTDGQTDGQQHVDFPASAPHALACGGTSLQASGTTISSESVWNDPGDGATGGGVSIEFPVPSYQASASVPDNVDTNAPGRGVPDVCGDADPQTGYQILVDGNQQTIGGTSAVAPLWAGLIARLNQQLGAPVGFAQPRLYPLLGTSSFHDITAGNNGSYSAGPGWDACSGLGSPDGTALQAALAAPASGTGADAAAGAGAAAGSGAGSAAGS
ncbi:MAG: S53 family peptidase [Solirubrobacteraceae bacterium]|jgi:kumamolisin